VTAFAPEKTEGERKTMAKFEGDDEELERGGYKPPGLPEGLSYREIEDRIFAAVDAEQRTLGQIKRHLARSGTFLGLQRPFEVDGVLNGMIVDKKLRCEQNGTITAYFRHETKPLRFWLGDGGVKAEFDETFRPRDEQKAAEAIVGSYEFNRPLNHGGKRSHAGGKPRVNIDPDRLAHLASTLPGQKEIAEALGIGSSTLALKLRSDREMRVRYDAARKQFSENHPPTHQRAPKGIDYTPELFRSLAAEGHSQSSAARKLGLSSTSVNVQLKKEANRAAWDEGAAEYERNCTVIPAGEIAQDPELMMDTNRQYDEIPVTAGEDEAFDEIRRKQESGEAAECLDQENGAAPPTRDLVLNFEIGEQPAQYIEILDQTERKIDRFSKAHSRVQSKSIIFRCGAKLEIGFEGNVFDLTPEERYLVSAIGNMIADFEEAAAKR
jgi:hypothetical protein